VIVARSVTLRFPALRGVSGERKQKTALPFGSAAFV
jgi:hypothetical protein